MPPNKNHDARYAYQPQPPSGYPTNPRPRQGNSSSLEFPTPNRENIHGGMTSRGRLDERENSSSSSSRIQRQGSPSFSGAPNLFSSSSYRSPPEAQLPTPTREKPPQHLDATPLRGGVTGTESGFSSSSRPGPAPNLIPPSSYRPPPNAQFPPPTKEKPPQYHNATPSRGGFAMTESSSSSSSRPGPMPTHGASSQPTYPPPSRTTALSSLPPRRDYDIHNPLLAPEPSQQTWTTHNLPPSSQLSPVRPEYLVHNRPSAAERQQTHAMYDWPSSSPSDHSLSSALGRQQTWPTHNLPQRSQIPPSSSTRPLRNEPPPPPIPAVLYEDDGNALLSPPTPWLTEKSAPSPSLLWRKPPQAEITLADVRKRLLDSFDKHVLNRIPTRLLEVSVSRGTTKLRLRLVTRDEIRRTLRPKIEALTDADLRDGRLMRESEVTSWCQARIQQYLAYAMFSHRWGDREPRFRQMLDQSRGVKPPPTGPGYEKLLRFCEKAVYDYDCKYVWSDTCCINKESSTELEEAIRAMYKWYSDASVCIVHLARSSSIRDFPSEPWFTRGWTLQELLAPRRMRFYGRDWTPICGEPRDRHVNDKQDESILVAISRLTEIPQNDLRNFSPSCNRVSEKMRWAAKRATTKVEDIAYSLIGIFKVSMPIAYGEGTEAFYTLMKVIAGQCTEPWFFAWCGEPSPYSCALPSSPACYRRLDPAMVDPIDSLPHGDSSYDITKLGLRVKLLLVPTTKQLDNVRRSDHSKPPQCTLHPAGGVLSSIQSFPYLRGEYALGVVNYERVQDGSVGELVHGDRYLCLVLRREETMERQYWHLFRTEHLLVLCCQMTWKGRPETVCLLHRD